MASPSAAAAATQQRYSLALYDDPHSEYSAKVKVALHAKGLRWETLSIPCGGTKSPDFLAVTPLGKIPALVVTDTSSSSQQVVVESEIILEFLEEAFPQQPLLPPPSDPLARGKARLLSRYHDLYLEPALRRLYPHVAPSVRQEAVVQEAVPALLERLEGLQALLPPVPPAATSSGGGGNSSYRLGFGDCGYPAALYYIELLLPVLGHGAALDELYGRAAGLRAWRDALWGQPAVVAVLAELRPAAEEWLQGKLRS